MDTAAREGHLDARSSSREELMNRVLDVCTGRPGVPLVLLTGQAGIGRSRVLTQIRARLAGPHVSTVEIRVSSCERDFPSLVGRIAGELDVPPARGESTTDVLRRLLASLTGKHRLVVFLDDAHRLAQSCLTAASALNAMAGAPITFVCAVRTPGPTPVWSRCAPPGSCTRNGCGR
ncbi:ATP-binding protein [Saccharopolyspora shandongensis]|uniref:ATP-binding protein n=1 Tax=Saccharopolyspora shandongensis TaxID=418495 RepID=UPI00343715A2